MANPPNVSPVRVEPPKVVKEISIQCDLIIEAEPKLTPLNVEI